MATRKNFINDDPWTTPEKFQKMRELFEKEVAENKPAKTATDVPLTYEHITKEWLTAVIAKNVPGAECTGFKLGEVDNGTANRRRIENITWNEAGQKAGLPSSVFCKGTMDLNNRLQLSFGGSASEVNFYKDVRSTVDFAAPVAWHSYIDPDSCASIIVLHDLTDKVEWAKYDPTITKENVKDQLTTLATLHGTTWESKDPKVTQFVPWALGFHAYLGTCDVESACVNGWKKSKGYVPEEMNARETDIWPATLVSYTRNGEIPYCLAHGDLHIGNWYKTPEGRMALQDYQCMGRGSFARDVGYVISTAVPVEKRQKWQDELLDHYLSELVKHGGPKMTTEEAWFEIDIQSFTVLAYWTLTLTPDPETMPDMQPESFTLEMIKRIAYFMQDRNVFAAYDKVKDQYARYLKK